MDDEKRKTKEDIVREALNMNDRYHDRNDLDPRPKKRCCPKCTMFSNWFKVVRSIDDEQLLAINGIDYTLYLVFLRYAAYLFLALTLYNVIFMLAIYGRGDPAIIPWSPKTVKSSAMDKFTILNVTGTQGKLAFVFFVTMFGVPLLAGIFLWKYRQLSKKWGFVKTHEVFDDIDLAYHTVMVKNLPTGVGVQELQAQLDEILHKVFTPN